MRIEDMYPNPGEGRKLVCYHEAAHAVFQHHAGLDVNYLSITPAGDGGVSVEWPCNIDPDQAVELAVSCAVGHPAEFRYMDQSYQHWTFEGFHSEAKSFLPGEGSDEADTLEMLEIAASGADDPQAALPDLYREICAKVDEGIEKRWPEIEAVAEQVFVADDGHLGGDEVVRIIESAQTKPVEES